MELEYIFTTPYILALLHLRGGFIPAVTLKTFENLSSALQAQFDEHLADAKTILQGLAKIKDEDKEAFAKIVDKVSQQTLISLCELQSKHPAGLSIEDCEKLGMAIDKLKFMFLGTLTGCYWNGTEKTEFKKKFLNQSHLNEIYNDIDIQNLSAEIRAFYSTIRVRYLNTINAISFEFRANFSNDDAVVCRTLSRL